MHPNLNPNTPNVPSEQGGEQLTFKQFALLITVWAALFAVGAVVMG